MFVSFPLTPWFRHVPLTVLPSQQSLPVELLFSIKDASELLPFLIQFQGYLRVALNSNNSGVVLLQSRKVSCL